MTVVIVGGSMTGWTTASALRTGGYTGSITVVESEPTLYDRPPLSKSAFVDGATIDSLAYATPDEWGRESLNVITGHAAVGLDLAALTVTLDDGRRLAADDIVLATGGRARRPNWPGATDPRVRLLRDYADAKGLRDTATSGSHSVVLGAGLIGAEVTSGLRALGVAVTLVDRNVVPLVPLVGPVMAGHLHAMHTAHGVNLVVDEVVAVHTTGEGPLTIETTSGATITATEVLAGVGYEPRTELAAAAGLDVDGGILVDADRRTSSPHVYAGGDVARERGPDGSLERLSGHWEAAQLDGHTIAAAILGTAAPKRGAPWFWSDRYGVHLEVVGRFTGAGREIARAGAAHPATFFVDDGLLVGAASVDDANTVRAARRIIDQQIPVDAPELADPSVTLRSLLKRTQ